MLSPEIAQLRELIATRIHAADCDCADFASPSCPLRLAGNYRAVADSVLELFPEVGREGRLSWSLTWWPWSKQRPNDEPWAHSRYVLRTAPEPTAQHEGPAA